MLERTGVDLVGDAVAVGVGPADVADAVLVGVELVGIVVEGAVVPDIGDAVAVLIAAAVIADAVVQAVFLVGIFDERAVVEVVGDAVAIKVVQAGDGVAGRVGDERTGIAGVADAVAVEIALVGIGYGGAVVQMVRDAVVVFVAQADDALAFFVFHIPGIWRVRAEIACVADAVAVAVGLLRVGKGRTVVEQVGNAVAIRVDGAGSSSARQPRCGTGKRIWLAVGQRKQEKIACVADSVAVGVALVWVGGEGAVVPEVGDAVAIKVAQAGQALTVFVDLLVGIGDEGANVACIADAVAVFVLLVRVVVPGTVVEFVGNAVIVYVGIARVAGVAHAAVGVVELLGIPAVRAVVDEIDDAVVVAITQPGQILASVADAVLVEIGLIGIFEPGAVVEFVEDAVVVEVWFDAAVRAGSAGTGGAGVAGIADAVAVGVGESVLDDVRAVVDIVGPAIVVAVGLSAAFADVAPAIVVGIALVCVGDERAVVAGVAKAVAVEIDLQGIEDGRAIVLEVGNAVAVDIRGWIGAGIADAIGVGIELVGVGNAWAVIANVADAVVVEIALEGIGDIRAIVAGVADAVAVAVCLVGVVGFRTIVEMIRDAVVVLVEGWRGIDFGLGVGRFGDVVREIGIGIGERCVGRVGADLEQAARGDTALERAAFFVGGALAQAVRIGIGFGGCAAAGEQQSAEQQTKPEDAGRGELRIHNIFRKIGCRMRRFPLGAKAG